MLYLKLRFLIVSLELALATPDDRQLQIEASLCQCCSGAKHSCSQAAPPLSRRPVHPDFLGVAFFLAVGPLHFLHHPGCADIIKSIGRNAMVVRIAFPGLPEMTPRCVLSPQWPARTAALTNVLITYGHANVLYPQLLASV